MVYNWDEFHDACYRLYIDEKKPLEEIMQIMRSEHGFAPRYILLTTSYLLPAPRPPQVGGAARRTELFFTHSLYPSELTMRLPS